MNVKLQILSLLFTLFSFKGFSDCGDSVVVEVCIREYSWHVDTFKTVTVFDSLDHPLSEWKYLRDGNTWTAITRRLYTYDSNGNLLVNFFECMDGSASAPIQQHTYTYNINNQVTTYLYEYSNVGGNYLKNIRYVTYMYDTAFNLLEETWYTFDYNTWDNTRRTTYFPDAFGNDTMIYTERGVDTTWINSDLEYITYNSDNLIVHDSVFQWDDGGQVWSLRLDRYTTWNGTVEDSILTYVYFLGTLTSQNYSLHIYDSINRNLAIPYFYWDGLQWVLSMSFDSIYYDQWWNAIKKINLSELNTWSYDSLGNLLSSGYQSNTSSRNFIYTYPNGILRHKSSIETSQGNPDVTHECDYYYAEIGGARSLCGNGSVELAAMPCSPGNQYLWSTGETTSSIFVTSPGTYTVTVTYGSGFSDVSIPFVVTNTAGASVELGNDTTICTGDILLIDAGDGFLSYVWSDSTWGQVHSTQSTNADTTLYFVTVTDTFGCTATDSVQIIFEICSGLSTVHASENNFIIFPNPASSQFTINSLQFTEDGVLEIYNLLGEKIYTSSYREPLAVNCEHFPRGIYFVQLRNREICLTRKLLIE